MDKVIMLLVQVLYMVKTIQKVKAFGHQLQLQHPKMQRKLLSMQIVVIQSMVHPILSNLLPLSSFPKSASRVGITQELKMQACQILLVKYLANLAVQFQQVIRMQIIYPLVVRCPIQQKVVVPIMVALTILTIPCTV